VNKKIQRQATVNQVVAGVYLGGMERVYSGTCAGSSAPVLQTMQVILLQSPSNAVQLQFSGADSQNVGQLFCVMQGNTVQHGKILSGSGVAYQCSTGIATRATTVEIDSLRRLDNGIEMHWHTTVN